MTSAMITKPGTATSRVSASTQSTAARRNPMANVFWNWAGVGIDAIAGFLITPLLIRELGDETYGLWVLIGSMTGCFGMLDMGMRGAVGRFVALHHAKGDQAAVQRVLSTAAIALCGVALVSLAGMTCATWALPRLFAMPAEQVAAVQSATLIIGVQLALFFVLRMFDATLWAYQRFDLLNMIDIPASLLRAGLITWLVGGNRGGLMTLAWISLAIVLGSGLSKCWLTYRVSPALQIHPAFAKRTVLRELLGYGFWNFLISVAALARTQLSPLLVGGLVGLSAVAPFSIVMRLPAWATMILTAATGAFTPVAVAIHARQDDARRLRLLVEGTCLSFSLALYFLALFVWLGKPLLSIWIRPEFNEHWPLLVVIGAGEVLPMTMSVAAGMVQAMARHRRLAWLMGAETAVALAAAALVGSSIGLIGFIAALACAATLFRGVLVLFYVCRLAKLAPLKFARQTLVRPFLMAAAACVPLHWAASLYPPKNWPMLFVYAGLFTVIYCVVIAWGVLGWDRVNAILIRKRHSAAIA